MNTDVLFNDGKFSVVSKGGVVIVTKYGVMINDFESRRTNLSLTQVKFLIQRYGNKAVHQMWGNQ